MFGNKFDGRMKIKHLTHPDESYLILMLPVLLEADYLFKIEFGVVGTE